jgi:hypothetical protein
VAEFVAGGVLCAVDEGGADSAEVADSYAVQFITLVPARGREGKVETHIMASTTPRLVSPPTLLLTHEIKHGTVEYTPEQHKKIPKYATSGFVVPLTIAYPVILTNCNPITNGARLPTLSLAVAAKNATNMARQYGGVLISWALAAVYPRSLIIWGMKRENA